MKFPAAIPLLRALPVRKDLQAHRELLVRKVQPACKALQARQVARKVTPALRVPLVRKAPSAPPARLVRVV